MRGAYGSGRLIGTRAARRAGRRPRGWWGEGGQSRRGRGDGEVIAAFEQDSGKQVELVLPEEVEFEDKLVVAIEAGRPPDIAFGIALPIDAYIREWAFEGRLVDLTDAIGHFTDLFDPDALAWYMLLNQRTQQRALYALPVGRVSNHVHVWKSLLGRAGFKLADVPKEWEAFWAFWCDQVQPAVRRATGRDDIWGVGLNMLASSTSRNSFASSAMRTAQIT